MGKGIPTKRTHINDFDWRVRVFYILPLRKLTHLSLSTLFCLIILGIVIRKQRSFIFYNFQKYFYEFCDLWWRSLKIEDYKPHWRLLRYIEMRIIKTWSKWIQSYNFLYVNSRAHLFIFMIHIRLFWLVITECSHSIIQDLSSYAFVWRRMFKIFTLTLACISCHYLATGILTVFQLVALLQKPSFQFNCNTRSEFKKGETFCWPSSWHCSSYFHTATDTKMLIFFVSWYKERNYTWHAFMSKTCLETFVVLGANDGRSVTTRPETHFIETVNWYNRVS